MAKDKPVKDEEVKAEEVKPVKSGEAAPLDPERFTR